MACASAPLTGLLLSVAVHVRDPRSGKAGGGIPPKPDGSEGAGPGDAKFTSTIHAKQGDLGSVVLKKGAPQARWKAGSEVEAVSENGLFPPLLGC